MVAVVRSPDRAWQGQRRVNGSRKSGRWSDGALGGCARAVRRSGVGVVVVIVKFEEPWELGPADAVRADGGR
jgi:hypothetical protein